MALECGGVLQTWGAVRQRSLSSRRRGWPPGSLPCACLPSLLPLLTFLHPLPCCPPKQLSPCSGELYPVETDARLCDALTTGTEVEVDMEADVLTDLSTGKKYSLKPLGDAGPVIDAGAVAGGRQRQHGAQRER